MAECPAEELLDQACANGFLKLAQCSSALADSVELQLVKSYAEDESTLGGLIEEACNNGFFDVAQSSQNQSDSVALQLLCNLT